MLVRNLTQGNLNLKSITSGKRIVLPPMKVIEIDELDFPAERIKKLFGRYVHILTEKVEEEDEVPTKPEENLELKKGDNNVSVTDETATKEEGTKDIGVENNDKNAPVEDTANDSDDVDKLVDSVLEEIETEDAGKKEEDKQEETTPAKNSKRTSRKKADK